MAAASHIRIARASLGILGLAVLACCLLYGVAIADATVKLVEAVLEVTLDDAQVGDMLVVLRGAQGQIYLEESDFARLRLAVPATAPYASEGHRYYDPQSIPGCTVKVDEVRQRAVISVPAAALDTTRVRTADRSHPAVTPASPGAFLNYQLSAQQVDGQNLGGAVAELGVFAAAGVLTNTVVARYGDLQPQQVVRLDSTFTRDFPDALETLNLGDAISDGGSWGNALRYAGVRWSRNFGLRPDLLTTPLLSTGGTATVPSTVDVFVNNQLINSNQLPAGPFVIDRLPTVSGTGDVSVVVRDAVGREQIVTQAFYSSVALLAPGLSQYSINVGKVRDDYALFSNHYGAALGEVSYRRGISDIFTVEGHGEYVAGDARAAGINAAVGLGQVGVVNFTAANGGNSNGSGWLHGFGIEHRGSNTSFVANTLWADKDFAQIGQSLDPSTRMRQRTLLQSGVGLGVFGSLSIAYVRETYREAPLQQTLSLTHSVNVGHFATLNLIVSRAHSAPDLAAPPQNSTSAYLIFVVPFDGRRAATLSAVSGSGANSPANELIASVTQSPPVGPGSGYRFSASTSGNYDADWRQQFRSADLEVEAARNQDIDGRSAYLSGAMTFLDGQLNTTRQVNGSFAMVDVAGLADVPVYVENQLTAHTDSSGRALLYNLRPYEANKISITPEDLPLDTAIGASKTLVAPPYRSGVIARFPVERIRSATFKLITEDHQPAPVGAVVTLRDGLFPVVLDGMVYVTGFDHGMSAEANWPGGHCMFRLQPPPPNEPLPDLGVVICRTAAK